MCNTYVGNTQAIHIFYICNTPKTLNMYYRCGTIGHVEQKVGSNKNVKKTFDVHMIISQISFQNQTNSALVESLRSVILLNY